LWAQCFVYIDNVLCSKTAAEHAKRLQNILRFDEASLQFHAGNCVFAQTQVHNLGFVLSENGVSISPEKVKALKQYLTPKSVRDVTAFLGLASFYRKLTPKFADLAKPLITLTRKDQKFYWGPSQQEAFDSLKDKLCSTHILAYPDF
jgi:hypothetical protein